MKSYLYAVCIFVVMLLFVSHTYATVGGPTTFERVSYSEQEKLVYYLSRSESGRGCPPIMYSLNIENNVQTPVIDCDVIENQYYKNGILSPKYYEIIEQTFSASKLLQRIDLSKNDISFDVKHIRDLTFDDGEKRSAEFLATIIQDSKFKGTFTFSGCYIDQPHVFDAYRIPETDNLLIKVSRIGNCFEGGYTEDSLFNIQGIDFKDTQDLGVSYASGPIVHRGNVVVFAEDSRTHNDQNPNNLIMRWTLFVVLGMGVGGAFGYILGKKNNITIHE